MTQKIYTHKDASPTPVTQGGPLTGKKIVLQPNMSVCGWPTNAGSRALEGFVALEDATVVARLREAGAALIGSARMSELGFGLTGDTLIEVLSSDGAHVGLIADTMGEARVVAAGSGFFGFKPSFGIVSRLGLIGLVPSMECYGIVARTVEEIIATIGVIAGTDENDFSMTDEVFPDFGEAKGPLKTHGVAGVVKECYEVLNESEAEAFKAGLAKLEEAGFRIQEVSLEDFNLFRTVHNVIGSVEASSSAGKYDGVRYGHRAASARNWNEMYLNSRGESFGTLIKAYLFQGAYFQFENYPSFEDACRIRGRLVRHMAGLFEKVDVLVFPTRKLKPDTAGAATINEIYEVFSLTLPANVTGQPSLNIPFIANDSGVDVGLQVLGPHRSDARLLALGVRLSPTSKGVQSS
jgi:aspartyl-tRNA(Asn)/glutamyl-tRNA(Gln) amidotransferase subunit A